MSDQAEKLVSSGSFRAITLRDIPLFARLHDILELAVTKVLPATIGLIIERDLRQLSHMIETRLSMLQGSEEERALIRAEIFGIIDQAIADFEVKGLIKPGQLAELESRKQQYKLTGKTANA